MVVKLCDVAPDGSSSLVTTGWLALETAAGDGAGGTGRRAELDVALVYGVPLRCRPAGASLDRAQRLPPPHLVGSWHGNDRSRSRRHGAAVETDVVHGVVATRGGLDMQFTMPTSAYIDARHACIVRARSGDRAEITLDITQAGDVISTGAEEHMTKDRIGLTSTVTVGGEERYRRTWERSWRAP